MATPKFIAVVVLPTPPFPDVIAIILDIVKFFRSF
jgi:hypothetical protein